MGCRSDYMKPTQVESQMSIVACLLDELAGNKNPLKYIDGMHPKVYGENLSERKRDKMVANLCAKCQKVNVTKQSLELQMWWRDHQKADVDRAKADTAKKKKKKDRTEALAKLSKKDRNALNIN